MYLLTIMATRKWVGLEPEGRYAIAKLLTSLSDPKLVLLPLLVHSVRRHLLRLDNMYSWFCLPEYCAAGRPK